MPGQDKVHEVNHPRRTGGGSLAGRIDWSDGWESPELDEQIADDFGMPSQPVGLARPKD